MCTWPRRVPFRMIPTCMTLTCTGASRAELSPTTSAGTRQLQPRGNMPTTSPPAWMAAPTARVRTAPPALLRAQWGCTHWPVAPRQTPSPWSASLKVETQALASTAVPHGCPQAQPTWRCYGGHSPCLSGAPARMGCSRMMFEKACRLALMGQGTSEQDPGKMKLQCSQVGNTTPSLVPPLVPGGASEQSGPLLCEVHGLGGPSNDQEVQKWFPPLGPDLFYCERTHGKNSGSHMPPLVPRQEVDLHKLVTCFLFIAPSLAAGREAGRPGQRLQLVFTSLV